MNIGSGIYIIASGSRHGGMTLETSEKLLQKLQLTRTLHGTSEQLTPTPTHILETINPRTGILEKFYNVPERYNVARHETLHALVAFINWVPVYHVKCSPGSVEDPRTGNTISYEGVTSFYGTIDDGTFANIACGSAIAGPGYSPSGYDMDQHQVEQRGFSFFDRVQHVRGHLYENFSEEEIRRLSFKVALLKEVDGFTFYSLIQQTRHEVKELTKMRGAINCDGEDLVESKIKYMKSKMRDLSQKRIYPPITSLIIGTHGEILRVREIGPKIDNPLDTCPFCGLKLQECTCVEIESLEDIV